MKQFEILSGRCLVVELPEGATDVTLEKDLYLSGPVVLWYMPDKNGVVNEVGSIDLPPGNWRIIGILSEVREAEAAKLVEKGADNWGNEFGYHDYFNMFHSVRTALESLESSILAEEWYFDPIGDEPIRLPEGHNSHGTHEAMWNQWREVQSRVLDRERCLLLGRETN